MSKQSVRTIESINSNPEIKNKFIFYLILILMSTAGLIGSDVYLPMLPNIGDFFHRNQHDMQFTLSIYLLGLSIGQIFAGPLTDRFGRKSLIIWGMLLYLFASIICALSPSYHIFIIGRLLQALGASSGLVIGRAIVGDKFDPKESGKIFSSVFPFVGMSPAIAPVIGGYIGHYFNWHFSFYFIAFYALLLVILCLFYLEETLDVSKRKSLHILNVISTYPKILTNRKFLTYVLAPCSAYIAYFSYISQSPFIFHSFGYGEKEIGLLYISLSVTYVLGNLIGKKLLNKHDLDKLITSGYLLFNVGSLILFLASFTPYPLIVMLIAISILTLGNGFLIPLGIAGAISSFPKSTGYASGLLGAMQLACATIASYTIGFLSKNTIAGLGNCIFIVTASCFVFYLILCNKKK